MHMHMHMHMHICALICTGRSGFLVTPVVDFGGNSGHTSVPRALIFFATKLTNKKKRNRSQQTRPVVGVVPAAAAVP